MWYCNNCKRIFSEPDTDHDEFGTYGVCPDCWNDDIEEADECPMCGDYFHSTGHDVCNTCRDIFRKEFMVFYKDQIDWYGEHAKNAILDLIAEAINEL